MTSNIPYNTTWRPTCNKMVLKAVRVKNNKPVSVGNITLLTGYLISFTQDIDLANYAREFGAKNNLIKADFSQHMTVIMVVTPILSYKVAIFDHDIPNLLAQSIKV